MTKAVFSGFDFAGLDLSNASFDSCNFSGAKLSSFHGKIAGMGATNWWDAAYIDGALLQTLLENYYPGFVFESVIGDKPLTKSDYTGKVMNLCKLSNVPCDTSTLKFVESNIVDTYNLQ